MRERIFKWFLHSDPEVSTVFPEQILILKFRENLGLTAMEALLPAAQKLAALCGERPVLTCVNQPRSSREVLG
jgi:hypothetical protein